MQASCPRVAARTGTGRGAPPAGGGRCGRPSGALKITAICPDRPQERGAGRTPVYYSRCSAPGGARASGREDPGTQKKETKKGTWQ